MERNQVWASRYFHIWPVTVLVRTLDPHDTLSRSKLSPARVAALSSLLRRQYAEDLSRWRPAVVAVDICNFSCAGLQAAHFPSIVDWFLVSPEFRDQWSHYRYSHNVADQAVYVRIDPASLPTPVIPPRRQPPQ